MSDTREQEMHEERRRLARWIELEAADEALEPGERIERENTAEALLFGVLESLPLWAPTEAFADRVLAQAGIVAPRRRHAALRYLAAACLVLLAIGASIIPFALVRLVQETGDALLVGLLNDLVVLGSQAAAGLLGMARAAAGVGGTLESVLSAPGALALAAAITLTSVAGFRWLHDLVMMERGTGYVSS